MVPDSNIRNAGSSSLAAIRNIYLAVTTKGIAAGYLAATIAATSFSAAIKAIPVVGWIAAAITGVGALAYALSQTKTHVAELNDEMEKLREKGDQTRNVDTNKMNRLKEMAELDKLSDKEKKLAQDLLGELKGKYGDFGVTMDETTGKLNVAADAVDRFNVKTKIETTSPKRTRQRLKAAGLDPSKYDISPFPGDFNDETLGDLIRRDANEEYWEKIYNAQFGGCNGCGSEERYNF